MAPSTTRRTQDLSSSSPCRPSGYEAPLRLTADDGHSGVCALPQGRLLTGRPVGGTVCPCCLRLYLLLEGFPWGKRGDLFRGNRDRVACAWVASCAGLALTEPKTAKAP